MCETHPVASLGEPLDARHLLAAKLRRSNIDAASGAVEEVARIIARIRRRWPKTRILLRGDSGFAREVPMAWCEANRVDYLFAWPATRDWGAPARQLPSRSGTEVSVAPIQVGEHLLVSPAAPVTDLDGRTGLGV